MPGKLLLALGSLALTSAISAPIAFADCAGGGSNNFDFTRITGGGYVVSCEGRNSFGFNVTNDQPNGLRVHLEYNDHQSGTNEIQVHANGYALPGARVITDGHGTDIGIEFEIVANVRDASGSYSETIQVETVDNGEPGTHDIFHLAIVSGPDAGYASGNPTIQGGNIQMHY